MLSVLFCLVAPSFGLFGMFDDEEDIINNNFESVFQSDDITERQNDPNINTIIDEFIVYFDLQCIKEKKSFGRNIIGEFLTEFPCYELNLEKEDKFPEIMDQWIIVNKNNECADADDSNGNKKIIWKDFCLTNVEQNEIWQEYWGADIAHVCKGCSCDARSVSDILYWSLDDACPDKINQVEYLNIESQDTDPNFDIIVMDGTGISSTHEQFIDMNITRIFDGKDGADITSNHATFMAGIIAGHDVGVARLANSSYVKLIDVRTESNAVSALVSGFDAIIDYLNNTDRKAIVILSFGNPGSGRTSIIDRIETVYNLDGLIIVAAGNLNISAYDSYPASSPYTISVGNHQSNLLRASASNYDVDIYAPGQGVYSALYSSDTSYTTGSGTSYAAPFVAGVAANILMSNPDYDLDDLLTKLLEYAAYDVNDRFGNTDLPRVQISCNEYEIDDSLLTTPSPTDSCNSDISGNCYVTSTNVLDGSYSGSYKQFCDPIGNGYRVTLLWSISDNCTNVDDIDIDGFNIGGSVIASYKYDSGCC